MIPGITPNPPRFDVFEPGDKTALVCMDVPEMERLAIEQLCELNHKVHTGHSIEDLLFKLRAHLYDVIVIAENFGATTIDSNPLLGEILREPASQRHKQLVVLTGASMRTADEMQAFQYSVDLVVSLADVMNLRPVIRRALMRNQEFYARYLEAIAVADVA
jgi:CheY-like chemotaxis protein